jgi:hypothetical protein
MGNVNGVGSLGIDGNLMVDGTIYANALSVAELSAIVANIGTITAGILSGGALVLNLNTGRLELTHSGDHNGTLHVTEGGIIAVGGSEEDGSDANILIDSQNNEIIIAPDGGYSENDYAKLTDGLLEFYYYQDGQHYAYNTVRRIESGYGENGSVITLPGYWRSLPNVIISPRDLQTFDAANSAQDQSLSLKVEDLMRNDTGRVIFTPKATLELAENSGTVALNDTYTDTGDGTETSYSFTSNQFEVDDGYSSITVNVEFFGALLWYPNFYCVNVQWKVYTNDDTLLATKNVSPVYWGSWTPDDAIITSIPAGTTHLYVTAAMTRSGTLNGPSDYSAGMRVKSYDWVADESDQLADGTVNYIAIGD